ncbi:hypothetical protein NGUA18_01821 [Salmonella enterica]|nr:hypothetical protein NGUA18_01821 [Salmonella enterica]
MDGWPHNLLTARCHRFTQCGNLFCQGSPHINIHGTGHFRGLLPGDFGFFISCNTGQPVSFYRLAEVASTDLLYGSGHQRGGTQYCDFIRSFHRGFTADQFAPFRIGFHRPRHRCFTDGLIRLAYPVSCLCHALRDFRPLLLQLFAGLNVRQTGAIRQRLPDKGLIRPAARKRHLYQRSFRWKLEHSRIVTGHWHRQRYGGIYRRLVVRVAVRVKQLHVNSVPWPERVGKITAFYGLAWCHYPGQFGQVKT